MEQSNWSSLFGENQFKRLLEVVEDNRCVCSDWVENSLASVVSVRDDDSVSRSSFFSRRTSGWLAGRGFRAINNLARPPTDVVDALALFSTKWDDQKWFLGIGHIVSSRSLGRPSVRWPNFRADETTASGEMRKSPKNEWTLPLRFVFSISQINWIHSFFLNSLFWFNR